MEKYISNTILTKISESEYNRLLLDDNNYLYNLNIQTLHIGQGSCYGYTVHDHKSEYDSEFFKIELNKSFKIYDEIKFNELYGLYKKHHIYFKVNKLFYKYTKHQDNKRNYYFKDKSIKVDSFPVPIDYNHNDFFTISILDKNLIQFDSEEDLIKQINKDIVWKKKTK